MNPRGRRSTFRGRVPALRPADLLGSTPRATGQTLGALALNSGTSLIAGVLLVALVPTFRRIPGLLVLTTPAIGLSGNVFTTLGNRLSTSIHLGTFRPRLRIRGVLGGNLLAATTLVLAMSVVLAAVARLVSVIGDEPSISLLQLVAIATVGGVLSAVPNTALTVVMALGAARWGWDLDNLVAPVVSTFGDVLTIPSLWFAAAAVDRTGSGDVIGVSAVVAALVLVTVCIRRAGPDVRRIVRESIPILVAALMLDTFGGLVLQERLEALAALPAVFVLVPAFVSSGGALGGILCSRASSALHLGNLEASFWPGRTARLDIRRLLLLSVPVFLLNGVGAVAAAQVSGESGAPGWWWTPAVSMIAAVVTMAAVVLLGWWTTVVAWRLDVDPDSAGVPIISAAIDGIGAVAIVTVVVVLALH